ncbi:Uncharacterised protein [Burkholderia pseudomallei]|uniref:hypothetical protein n=1 Tax=Burkholderia pseudomallei TaxID=28450 RepID=UPI0005DCC1FE|nr:hypothetical protein [Burkholderia pseudomallei]QUN86058.1 hypothetical protein KEX46_14465 [Burkholderia pseudomallei]CPH57475.1 Uncharacterised protein [Burkholderia pseudomallei]
MAKTQGYTPLPTPLLFDHDDGRRFASEHIAFGGWNHETRELSSIRARDMLAKVGNSTLSWVFDSLAAATEAGVTTPETYISQLFASRDDLDAFLGLLDVDSDIWWVNDRHFHALEWLGKPEDRLTAYITIAEILTEDGEEIDW